MGHAVALLTGPDHGLGAVGHGSAADPVPDLDFLTVHTEANNVPKSVTHACGKTLDQGLAPLKLRWPRYGSSPMLFPRSTLRSTKYTALEPV
ncbi:hypothetical protein N7513_008819 [Penicillium frequentans]|nr:hypothetical protein N7513_008819 [Penicillium glabrum]